MRPDFPLPDLDWEPTREFWSAAARHELVIPRCQRCAAYCWYPPADCPGCGGPLAWSRVSGRGRLYSWAVVERALVGAFADKVPYVTGLVALEEDPAVRLVTNLVDCEARELRVGMPLCAVFRPLVFPDTSREVVAPLFAPTR